jgi:hypothetical protein
MFALLIPGLLGGSDQKQAVTQTINAINSAVNSVVNTTSNTSNVTSTNRNSFTLKMDQQRILVPGRTINRTYIPPILSEPYSCKGCTFNIGQSITSTQNVGFNTTITDQTKLTNDLSNAIQQTVSQTNSSTQDALSTAMSKQSNEANLNTNISNYVNNSITNEVINTLNQIVTNANNGVLLLSGNNDGSTFNSPQTVLNTQISNVISNALLGSDVTNTMKNSAQQTTTQTNSSVQKGLLDGLFSGPFLIIAAVIAVCVVGFIIFKMVSGGSGQQAGGQSQAQQVGNGLSEFGMQLSRFCGFGVRRRNFGKSTRFGKSRR